MKRVTLFCVFPSDYLINVHVSNHCDGCVFVLKQFVQPCLDNLTLLKLNLLNGHVARTPGFRVSNIVILKPACSAIELFSCGNFN